MTKEEAEEIRQLAKQKKVELSVTVINNGYGFSSRGRTLEVKIVSSDCEIRLITNKPIEELEYEKLINLIDLM